ncbi:hypothetical protein A9K55_005825 [Cordyceps militaris]|uniref:Uncharacterized protein n=1 Tax=Cordyceps militaris TaxID=73501 RepID=A0A2H4SAJ6_CORMI|nr:hypothetical protein A9K55_005825 [Cordyceps militaris]
MINAPEKINLLKGPCSTSPLHPVVSPLHHQAGTVLCKRPGTNLLMYDLQPRPLSGPLRSVSTSGQPVLPPPKTRTHDSAANPSQYGTGNPHWAYAKLFYNFYFSVASTSKADCVASSWLAAEPSLAQLSHFDVKTPPGLDHDAPAACRKIETLRPSSAKSPRSRQ